MQEVPAPSLNVHDILFVLFKHKRTILICTAFGLVAAAAAFFLYPPLYQSQAKLLVRYVVERSAVDAVDTNSNAGGNRSNLAIAAEVEILTSRDLAAQVAEAIGEKRLLGNAKGTPSNAKAAEVVAIPAASYPGVDKWAMSASDDGVAFTAYQGDVVVNRIAIVMRSSVARISISISPSPRPS